MVAPALTGHAHGDYYCWGHTMIIDPFGTVLARRAKGQGIVMAEVDLDYLKGLRTRMPQWEQRRPQFPKP
jgi:nitrilase